MKKALHSKLKEALASVLPVTIILLGISCTPLVHIDRGELLTFCLSALFLVLGIALFNLGADLAMTPMGEHVGEGLTKSKRLSVLLTSCFVMGVLITVAEPDLSVLADQVGAVLGGSALVAAVGLGVGAFLLLAVLRILFSRELSSLLLFFYLLLFAAAAILMERGRGALLPVAFDAGGVTTGPITVPFIMALGVGIAQTLGGRNAGENSFGLIALCSIGPIAAVLLLGAGSRGELLYELPSYGGAAGEVLRHALPETALEVARSLALLCAFFAVLQMTVLKLPRQKLGQILVGIAYTFVGLVIFLCAVAVGFMPLGFRLGTALASAAPAVQLAFAFGLGLVVVLAEPAVHVLNRQVEEITNGGVSRGQMRAALSLGVGLSVGLSVLRIRYGFSLLYYLIPGYLLSLGLSFFVPPLYTAIAFDSGGVASGPLTSGLILPMAIGVCVGLHGESQVLSHAFGVVAMVAMAPLITIQTLGFRAIMSKRARDARAMRRILAADDAQIIYFE